MLRNYPRQVVSLLQIAMDAEEEKAQAACARSSITMPMPLEVEDARRRQLLAVAHQKQANTANRVVSPSTRTSASLRLDTIMGRSSGSSMVMRALQGRGIQAEPADELSSFEGFDVDVGHSNAQGRFRAQQEDGASAASLQPQAPPSSPPPCCWHDVEFTPLRHPQTGR